MLAIALLLAVTPAREIDEQLYRGEWERVLGDLRRRQDEASKGTDHREQTRIAVLLARAQVTSNAYHLRDETLTDQVTARSLQLAEQEKDPALLAEALLARGRLLYWRAFHDRRWDAAQAPFERARPLCAQAGDAHCESEAWFYLGLIEQQQDRLEAGDERFRKGLALARASKDAVQESFIQRHLAASAEARGLLDEAEKGFGESLRLRLEQKACVLSPFAQLTLAEFYEKSHRSLDKVRRLVEDAAASASRCGSNRAAIDARLTLARATSSSTDRRKLLNEALALARRFDEETLVKEVEAALEALPGGFDGGAPP